MRREEFEWLERQVQKLKNVMDALHDFCYAVISNRNF